MDVPAVPAAEQRLPAIAEAPATDPYHVYLDSLASAESRRTMRGCLDRIARVLTGDEAVTGAGMPWHLLRYEHTVRIRTVLTEQGWSPAYVNKHLVALRRVLKEALAARPDQRGGVRPRRRPGARHPHQAAHGPARPAGGGGRGAVGV
ncbi:hypothetical protein [Nonomuraea dietziae]|uniref:hypothetical protein n=1 Tax=Nonomuraea dietziae TaxID=65515 RepID=UPI0031DE88B8